MAYKVAAFGFYYYLADDFTSIIYLSIANMKNTILFGLAWGFTGMVMAQSEIIAHLGYHKTRNSVGNSLSALKNTQDAGFYATEFE